MSPYRLSARLSEPAEYRHNWWTRARRRFLRFLAWLRPLKRPECMACGTKALRLTTRTRFTADIYPTHCPVDCTSVPKEKRLLQVRKLRRSSHPPHFTSDSPIAHTVKGTAIAVLAKIEVADHDG